MGLFDEIDLENAPSDPFNIPPGAYNAFLTDIKPGSTDNKPGKKFIIFQYKLSGNEDEASAFNGSEVSEWKSANPDDDERTKGFLKQRLLSLGVPEDRINEVNEDDLIGAEVVITLKKNGDYTNVNKVVLVSD